MRRHAASPAFGNEQRGLALREDETIAHAAAGEDDAVDHVSELSRQDDGLDVVGLARQPALPSFVAQPLLFHILLMESKGRTPSVLLIRIAASSALSPAEMHARHDLLTAVAGRA